MLLALTAPLFRPRSFGCPLLLLLPRQWIFSRDVFPTSPPPPFVGVRFGFSSPFNCLVAPHPAGEHVGQREGKDVPVLLRCSSRGIFDSRRGRFSLLHDAVWCWLGTSFRKIHRQKVLPAGWGDVSSMIGARNHLCCLADNQPYSSLVGPSDRDAQRCLPTI